MKKHLGFILFFSAVILIFLGKLIFMKAAFLGGDYLVQFYPWSKVYSYALKNFVFPFWTRYIGSGFPLLAEGQVAGLYPFNIIMFFLLPCDIAYNYSIILHFILAGVFTYIYTREIGADAWGGALSALLFCFGSAYAGCFVNTATVVTVTWVPLSFFLFEKYFKSKKSFFLILIGIILGVQSLGGAAQMAFYSAIFYIIYFICALVARKQLTFKDIVLIAISLFIAAIIFYPQFILSLPLLQLSGRSSTSLGFALWGSFNLFNFISICFPSLVFYGAQFYVGVLTILFLIAALLCLKKEPKIKQLFIMLLFSIFFALGAYNPLYVLILKMTKVYSLRNPSKFIFFGVFAVCVLSGWGFTKFFAQDSQAFRKKTARIFVIFISSMLAFLFFVKTILILFRDKIIRLGEWYATKYIFGKEHHRYGLETYLKKIENFYEQLLQSSSLANIFLLASVVLCIISLMVCVYLLKKNRLRPFYKTIFMGFIFIDIFIYSFYGTGFRGNIKSFSYLKPTHNNILEFLKSDKELYRILPFGVVGENMPLWLKPNANILVGIDSIAIYTPLAQSSYKGALSSLEVVDDSLGLILPQEKALKENQYLLGLLNIKYVVSTKSISFDFLEKVIEEGGVFLYRLKEYLPRIFFTGILEGEIREQKIPYIKIVKYESGLAEIEVLSDKKGFLIFSENYYLGWKAYVDGLSKEIIKVKGLVQGVAVEEGKHTVVFKYKPTYSFSKE
ncbi:MAG: YfhO family protein [Candidatus Omnitrophota bacterium]|nr:YfhO family protein [Candidatus Omnitrophota bacterium]